MLRLLRLLVLAIVWFMGISFALVILFRFVPVPVTATMLLDENGITKDWTPLSRIDRNMVSAAIAGEDGKFCSHDGFDREAIEEAIRRNQQGASAAVRRSASRPPRTYSCGKAAATSAKGSKPGSRC